MSTVLLRVCHFFKKCIIKYFKKIDVSKLFLSFLFFFFLFFLIFFLILVFSLFFQFFFLFLSPSSVYPVCVQPAVDIIPGTDLVFLEAAEPREGSQGGKKAQPNAGQHLTENTQNIDQTLYILVSLT